jgi:hypothetical protein
MHAFTIDADNNITVHPNKKIARQTGAGVFDTAENFAELIGADNKRLVEIWNSLTGVTPVKNADYFVMEFVDGVPVTPADSTRKLLDIAIGIRYCAGEWRSVRAT